MKRLDEIQVEGLEVWKKRYDADAIATETRSRQEKCLSGEHEAGAVCKDGRTLSFFIIDGAKVLMCRHCRCLFVEA